MRRTIFKSGIVLFVFIIGSQLTAKAQNDIDKFLETGLEDANRLIGGYVEPFMKGFGTALGNGWTNTAKTHKSLGFDFTVTVNAAYIPDEDMTYDPTVGSSNLSYTGNSIQPSPTLFGAEQAPEYSYSVTENDPITGNPQTYSGTFFGPEGIGLKDNVGIKAIPIPMAQLGIGIVKNTDLKFRWTPKINLGNDGEFKMFGVAVMHDVKQYIPGIKLAPFDLSVLIGFTDISLEYSLADQGATATAGEVYTPDGRAVYDVNTWTFQALISKKFSVLTLYGGIGLNKVKSETGLKGTYQVTDDFGFVEREYVDPILVTSKLGGARLTTGMRLKLAIVTLHADYTIQKYNTLTVGFGFAVR